MVSRGHPDVIDRPQHNLQEIFEIISLHVVCSQSGCDWAYINWYAGWFEMGNSNASATKSSTNGDVQKVGDGGENIPALNGNGTVGKQQKTSTVVNKDEEFIVHGIDYLPEFEKRNERRKKNVPKILRIDSINWTANYLHFFSRNNHGSRTTVQSEKSSTTGHDDKTLSNGDITLQNRHISRSGTVDIIVDENANDWVSHPDYPFENIVMSGGGSKGYAYIGSLKVCLLFWY